MKFKPGIQVDTGDIISAGYNSMGAYQGFPDPDYCQYCEQDKPIYGYMNKNRDVILICSMDHVIRCPPLRHD